MNYELNKGIGESAEFKGLKAQYLFIFVGGLLALFVLFVILYMGYLGVILCEPLLWIPMTIQLYFSLRNTPDVCLSARSPFSLIQSPFISYLFHNYFLRHNAKSKHIS